LIHVPGNPGAEKQTDVSNATSTTPYLTPEQFHTAVLELAPTVAVFDCDGTLWSGDAGSAFMHWTVETGLISRETADWIDAKYRSYKRGDVSELDICGQMVQMYHGLHESEMRAAARTFFAARIEKNIFPEMLALISELNARGVEIWAVSSTNDWVIEEGVQRFGIPTSRVLAARVQVKNGIVTENLLDVPTDEGKVASLKRLGITQPHAVFGNSIHDAHMLAIAHSKNGTSGAFSVNPTPALAQRSTEENWPIFYPKSVTLPTS
jgi:HAD superfamily phosphoserine phosphatase-like hydrolase